MVLQMHAGKSVNHSDSQTAVNSRSNCGDFLFFLQPAAAAMMDQSVCVFVCVRVCVRVCVHVCASLLPLASLFH